MIIMTFETLNHLNWSFATLQNTAETFNTVKNRLDKFWYNQDVLYDYRADFNGIGNCTIVMYPFYVI